MCKSYSSLYTSMSFSETSLLLLLAQIYPTGSTTLLRLTATPVHPALLSKICQYLGGLISDCPICHGLWSWIPWWFRLLVIYETFCTYLKYRAFVWWTLLDALLYLEKPVGCFEGWIMVLLHTRRVNCSRGLDQVPWILPAMQVLTAVSTWSYQHIQRFEFAARSLS